MLRRLDERARSQQPAPSPCKTPATSAQERNDVLTDAAQEFLSEYHLATLSTLDGSGRIHSVPVGLTYLDGVVRVIGSGGSQKFVNAERSGRASVNTVDGRRWISFEGPARVRTDDESVALAVALYAARYRQPRPNPQRVVLELTVERVLGSAGMRVGDV
jgi:PPOX class probable F420-dependent enzyme